MLSYVVIPFVSRLESGSLAIEEEEGHYKMLSANTADHWYQLWQPCSNHHEISTAYYVLQQPHMIRLGEN